MKRSAQIGLLVMGTLATTSAAGYFAVNHDQACQARAANNPQGAPPQDCRRSVWHGSSGSRSYFGSSSSSESSNGPSGHSSSGTSSAARGGFGGGGHGGSGS